MFNDLNMRPLFYDTVLPNEDFICLVIPKLSKIVIDPYIAWLYWRVRVQLLRNLLFHCIASFVIHEYVSRMMNKSIVKQLHDWFSS